MKISKTELIGLLVGAATMALTYIGQLIQTQQMKEEVQKQVEEELAKRS